VKPNRLMTIAAQPPIVATQYQLWLEGS